MNEHIDNSAAGDDVSALYDRYFAVMPATTPSLLDAAHELRHQVYCVEHHYENASPSGREFDQYDAHSVHAVLLRKASEAVVGCVRLVLPGPEGVSALPIYHLLDGDVRQRLLECDPKRTAEISRYAVSKALRRREGEELYPDVSPDDRELGASGADLRRLAPHLSVGLLRGVALLAAAHGVRTVCAAMAPSLLRLLKRFGVEFEPLGPPIDYHGFRQPCMADCLALLDGIKRQRYDCYQALGALYQQTPGPIGAAASKRLFAA